MVPLTWLWLFPDFLQTCQNKQSRIRTPQKPHKSGIKRITAESWFQWYRSQSSETTTSWEKPPLNFHPELRWFEVPSRTLKGRGFDSFEKAVQEVAAGWGFYRSFRWGLPRDCRKHNFTSSILSEFDGLRGFGLLLYRVQRVKIAYNVFMWRSSIDLE